MLNRALARWSSFRLWKHTEGRELSDDAKLDFYLKHRAQIQEWAELGTYARSVLERALLAALEDIASDDAVPAAEVTTRGARIARLRIPGAEQAMVWVELNWTGDLLTRPGDRAWPALIVCASPKPEFRDVRERIKESTRSICASLGLTRAGTSSDWWVWSARLVPESEPLDIDDYVAYCTYSFREAWMELHGTILDAIKEDAP